MAFPYAKVFQLAALIYKLFLKGKTINLPGGGEFTLPQQGHTIPGVRPAWGGYSLPRNVEDELPKTVPPPEPLSAHTLAVLLFVVFGLPLIALIVLGVVEWRTLADDIEGNHITATAREVFRRQPGAVFLATLVWVAFLSAIFWGLAGHFFFT